MNHFRIALFCLGMFVCASPSWGQIVETATQSYTFDDTTNLVPPGVNPGTGMLMSIDANGISLFSGNPTSVACEIQGGTLFLDSGNIASEAPDAVFGFPLNGGNGILYRFLNGTINYSPPVNQYANARAVPQAAITGYLGKAYWSQVPYTIFNNGGRLHCVGGWNSGQTLKTSVYFSVTLKWTAVVPAAKITLNTGGRSDLRVGWYHNFLADGDSNGWPDSVAQGQQDTYYPLLSQQYVDGEPVLQFVSSNEAVMKQGPKGYFTAVGPGTCNITVTCDGVTKVVPMTVQPDIAFKGGLVGVNAPSTLVDLTNRLQVGSGTPTSMQITEVVGGTVSPLTMAWGNSNWGKVTITTNGLNTGSFKVTVNDSAGKTTGPQKMAWVLLKETIGPQGDPIAQIAWLRDNPTMWSVAFQLQPRQKSADPIRYANGEMEMYEDDLEIGQTLPGFVRSYSNLASQVDGLLGPAWVLNCTPFVYANQGYICAVLGADTQIAFADNAGVYTPLYTVKSTLRAVGADLLYADVTGTRVLFHGLATTPVARAGKIKSMFTPSGVRIDYVYTSAGVLSRIVRTVSATTTDEVRLDVDGNGRIFQARHVAVVSGEVTTIRTVSYIYYGGGAGEFGDEGYLKAVTVKDGANAIIRQFYYRYYRQGEVDGFAGGLRVAVGPRNYARMAANYKDPMALTSTDTDALIQPYTDKAFRYDTAGRVTRQDLQTSDVDGSGTYTYTYVARAGAATPNSWLMRTTETCPDNSVNIVYTNKAGDILLKVRKATAGATEQWIDAYNYDASTWALKWHFTPAAVIGFSEANPDLIAFSDTPVPASANIQPTTGLIESWDYIQSGVGVGYPSTESERIGLNGTKILRKTKTYVDRTIP